MAAYNRVKFTTATTGTGTLTVGAASTGFATPAGRSIPDGALVDYTIEDGSNSEVGQGVTGSSATTLTRDANAENIVSGTPGTGPITLSGSAVVFITVRAKSLNKLTGYAAARVFVR